MKSSSPEGVVTWTTSQVVLATIFVVCVFLTFWLLYRLREVLFLFFVAIVVGTAIRPAVDWLHRRGISRATGIIILYLLIAALLTGFLAMTLPILADQATELSWSLPEYYASFHSALINSGNRLLQNIGWRMPGEIALLMHRDPNSEEVLDQVGHTLFYTNVMLKGMLGTLAVFLLAYYWTQEGQFVARALVRIMPPSQKKNVREFLQLAETKLGGYIRGQGLLCVAVGLAAFFAYLMIGLPYVLILAIFAGVMEMIPIFGPALGAIPAFLVALSVDPSKAIWVVVATAVIQMLENAILVPRIMRHSMGVNPIIVLLSLIAFGSVFGFVGALLAIPLAAIIQLLVSRVVLTAAESARRAQDKELAVQSLINESQQLMETLDETTNQNSSFRELPEGDRLEMYSLTERLDQLLRQLKEEGEAA
jgi:predicted PurR-regulated permease PerM